MIASCAAVWPKTFGTECKSRNRTASIPFIMIIEFWGFGLFTQAGTGTRTSDRILVWSYTGSEDPGSYIFLIPKK